MQNTPFPLTAQQRQQICRMTDAFVERASKLYQQHFTPIAVHFDLKGRCAGMFCIQGRQKLIRYNPYIFAKYYDDNLHNTVAHEVAHYIVYQLYGRRVQPHGAQWRRVMLDFKRDPSVYCNYDLQGIPVKKYQHIEYHCQCGVHKLTKIRHNRILKGARYYCKKCGKTLKRFVLHA